MTIRTERPPKVRPAMPVAERAKQFAPYAALGSMDPVLQAIIDGRGTGDFERVKNLEDFNLLLEESPEFADDK